MSTLMARFVEEYLVDGCGSRAVLRAGYKTGNAAAMANELKRDPRVAKAISEGQASKLEEIGVRSDAVLQELARIAFVDPGDMFDDFGNLKPVSEMPEGVRRAIASYEGPTDKAGAKVRTADKLSALGQLARHLGISGEGKQASVSVGGPVPVEITIDLSAG